MGTRRIAALALSGAIVAGGTGAAIAAVSKNDGRKVEQAILDDAAKRLDVTPEKLRDALAAAHDAQIDEDVKAGRLTERQADALKAARRKSGHVLGPLGGPGLDGRHLGPGGPRLGMRRGLLADIAKAAGTTPQKLVESLRAGTSLADVAKANGRLLADVRNAARAAVKTRLDKAVADGDLTRRQADATLERVDEKLKAIATGKALRLRRHGLRGGGRRPHELRPGALLPGGEAPQLLPPGAIHS